LKHLSGAPLWVRLLALPTNIRLDWKGLPGTNTLAYYKKIITYVRKKFYNIGSSEKTQKIFLQQNQKRRKYKLGGTKMNQIWNNLPSDNYVSPIRKLKIRILSNFALYKVTIYINCFDVQAENESMLGPIMKSI
jgi:hypothetical protein